MSTSCTPGRKSRVVVSVVIPVYGSLTLDNIVRSQRGNSEEYIEWIVVNDGTSDELRQAWPRLDRLATVVDLSENRGQAAARNVGLSRASGDYVMFLDCDDYIDDGAIAALLDAAELQARRASRGDRIAFMRTCNWSVGGGRQVNSAYDGIGQSSSDQFLALLNAPFLHHCGALYPVQLIRRIGGYDESLRTDEDGDLLIRLSSLGVQFFPVEGYYYNYVAHDGLRVSLDDSEDKLNSRYCVARRALDLGLEMGVEERDLFCRVYSRLAVVAEGFYLTDRQVSRRLEKRAVALCESLRRAPLWSRLFWVRYLGDSAMPTYLIVRWLGRQIRKGVRRLGVPMFR